MTFFIPSARFFLRLLYRLIKWFLITMISLFLLFLLLDWIYPTRLPDTHHAQAIISESGDPLRFFATEDGIWRYQVSLDSLSPNYLEALLQYEDKHFYQHPGVNPLSLVRAVGQWVTTGRPVSGGSTLTMQVARLVKPMNRTVWGKAKQIFWALQLEWHHSKEEILTYYVNHAPFGGPIEGVEAASRAYFGYSADQLTDAQAALLTVLPQSPSRYRPDRYPERAQQARDKVILRMQEFGIWNEQTVNEALLEPVIAQNIKGVTYAPLLARRLHNQLQNQAVVKTFIDLGLQRNIEHSLATYVRSIDKHASAAIMVMDHQTGNVLAYAGSSDFLNDERFGHVDMIRSWRSPGSTLKPFIYGLAMDQGLIHSHSLLMDIPTRFGQYQPDNFDTGFNGPVSVATALYSSLNVPAVQILNELGPKTFYSRLHSSLVPIRLPKGNTPSLAIALGGAATTLEDLVSLYASLGNGGYTVQPRYYEQDKTVKRQLLTPETAWVIRQLLPGDSAFGHVQPAQHDWAWKTGTSYGYRDTWAVGVNSRWVIAVWVGRPDAVPIVGHYGSKTAVPLLKRVSGFLPQGEFVPPPKEVTQRDICWPSGKATEDAHNCDKQQKSWVVRGQIPPTLMLTGNQSNALDFAEIKLQIANDSGLRVPLECNVPSHSKIVDVWPTGVDLWIPIDWRKQAKIGEIDPRCAHIPSPPMYGHTVYIRGLWDNDRIRKHAITLSEPKIQVQAEGGIAPWHWFVNGKLLEEKGESLTLKNLTPGHYQLSVMDNSGASDKVEFTIEN